MRPAQGGGWLVFLCWLFPLLASASLPPGVRFGDTPAWVETLDAASLLPAAPANGIAYRVVEDQLSLLGEQPAEYRRLLYDVVDRSGLEEAGRLRISFQPDYQEVVVHTLGVVRDGARLDRRTGARVELLRLERRADEGILDGRRTAEFLLEDVQVGDQVELAFTVIGGNPVFGRGYHTSWYLEYSQGMAARRIRAVTPAGRFLAWRAVGSDAVLSESIRDDVRTLLLDLRDVPAVVEEESLPAPFPAYGIVEFSTARDWSDVASWAVELFRLRASGEGAVAMQARKLDLSELQPEQALQAALAFVQREVRYVSLSIGESSHAPAAPETTLSRRFGDCKDKSLLLVALLAEAGVTAEPVLVNTRWRGATHEHLASPLAFDHAIVRVRLNDEWHYFDPTRNTELGGLPYRAPVRFGQGLPVSPGVEALVAIPRPEREAAGVEVTQDVQMVGRDGEQRADVRVSTAYRYEEANRLRARFAATPARTIGDEYLGYMQGMYRDMEQVSEPVATDDPEFNELTVTEHYLGRFTDDADQPAAVGEFRLRLFQLADWIPTASRGTRRQPLNLSGPERGVQEIRVHLPGGWDIEPVRHRLENEYFRFHLDIGATGELLTMRGEWNRLADAIPPEAYAKVRSDLHAIRDLLDFPILIGGKAKGIEVGPRDLAWPALGLMALAMLLAGMWWLRRRNAVAGMFFAPRAAAAVLFESSSVWVAVALMLAGGVFISSLDALPDLLAGITPDWQSLGLEVLASVPQALFFSGLLYGVFRMFGHRPRYRHLLIAGAWALWPLLLILPLALLACWPALPLIASEPLAADAGAPLAWSMLAIGLLLTSLSLVWAVVSGLAACSVAAGCTIAKSLGVHALSAFFTFMIALIALLAYLVSTGTWPAS